MISIASNGEVVAKISNLGFIKKQNKENPKLYLGLKGTVGWTSPELCNVWLKKEQKLPLRFEVRSLVYQ